ncbi:AraC family transcriptional regulator [Nocardioides pantholopis]|uniref:AraC family transcriptional regulator n=1 Tax=Nocardioides pantholopis TaxID=2483798 RepID=UPI000F08D491|nr:AraC family transcriptional regulator [Nocardioides pantholopis]
MVPTPTVRAWRPPVAGVVEVLHAYFPDHAYPRHTHDTWTVLLVDAGTVAYDLERRSHGTVPRQVTVLPPHVAHDGRAASAAGFRKRVVYLEEPLLGTDRVGAAVDRPGWADPVLAAAVDGLHGALVHPGDGFEAESRLALVADRLARHLAGRDVDAPAVADRPLAWAVRELLDGRVVEGVGLADVARATYASPTHVVRAFTAEFGLPPHRYLTGRRLDLARRRLLAGERPADVAVAVGFHDQAHLGRHFRRLLGVAPGAYARSAR